MDETNLDQLFLRYARSGDVRAVGELFDSAAPQLARVAWHIVRDASEVEDLVQATFLTALDSAGKFDASKPVMPWLLGILVNHARNARRAAARRPEPLPSEIAEEHDIGGELERRELLAAISRAVTDLPETYRAVVASWWSDGASPTEIAARTGASPATVRVQLHRGLRLVRRSLPGVVATLGTPRLGAQITWVAAREHVMARAGELSTVPTAGAPLTAGGIITASKLWLATGLIGAAAFVWWLSREPDKAIVGKSGAELSTRAGVTSPNAVISPSETIVETPAAELQRIERTSVPTAASGWWLLGRTDVDVDSELARVSNGSRKVEAHPELAWTRDVRGRSFEVDLTHLFGDPTQAPKELVIRYDHPRFMPHSVHLVVASDGRSDAVHGGLRTEFSAEFHLVPSHLTVRGFVAPELAATAFAALFRLDETGVPEGNATEQSRCESDGSFLVRSSFAGEHALAVAVPGWRPLTIVLTSPQAHVVDLGGLALGRGARLTGRVIDAPDSIAGCAVAKMLQSKAIARPVPGTLEALGNSSALGWIRDAFEWTSVRVPLGGAREFAIYGLANTEYTLSSEFAQMPKLAAPTRQITVLRELDSSSEGERFVATTDGIELASEWRELRTLRIAVRHAGAPVSGAELTLGGRSSVELQDDEIVVWFSNAAAIEVYVSKEGVGEARFLVEANESSDGELRIVELQ